LRNLEYTFGVNLAHRLEISEFFRKLLQSRKQVCKGYGFSSSPAQRLIEAQKGFRLWLYIVALRRSSCGVAPLPPWHFQRRRISYRNSWTFNVSGIHWCTAGQLYFDLGSLGIGDHRVLAGDVIDASK
jgi:hypothetical protein